MWQCHPCPSHQPGQARGWSPAPGCKEANRAAEVAAGVAVAAVGLLCPMSSKQLTVLPPPSNSPAGPTPRPRDSSTASTSLPVMLQEPMSTFPPSNSPAGPSPRPRASSTASTSLPVMSQEPMSTWPKAQPGLAGPVPEASSSFVQGWLGPPCHPHLNCCHCREMQRRGVAKAVHSEDLGTGRSPTPPSPHQFSGLELPRSSCSHPAHGGRPRPPGPLGAGGAPP